LGAAFGVWWKWMPPWHAGIAKELLMNVALFFFARGICALCESKKDDFVT
jgi:hypothetical protein